MSIGPSSLASHPYPPDYANDVLFAERENLIKPGLPAFAVAMLPRLRVQPDTRHRSGRR